MRSKIFIAVTIVLLLSACQNSEKQKQVKEPEKAEAPENSRVLAIDILLDPDSVMLDASKDYNDRLHENYPEGFELDESHKPHITIVQSFVKASDLDQITEDLNQLLRESVLSNQNFLATGLYYISYDDKGLAGITIKKDNLSEFHNKVIELIKKYKVPNGEGSAFVPRPDGEPIMEATVDYVNTFDINASGEKFNPHVTIGTAYKDFVDQLLEEEFSEFTFKVNSVSIYQLGELGTAQKKLITLEL